MYSGLLATTFRILNLTVNTHHSTGTRFGAKAPQSTRHLTSPDAQASANVSGSGTSTGNIIRGDANL